MSRKVPLAAETLGDAEAFHRAGVGLPEHYASRARVAVETERLRRRGVVIDVRWMRHATRCRFRKRTIAVGVVRVTLQLPRSFSGHDHYPAIRTEHGESAVYSPPHHRWTRTHGEDPRWTRLLARAPEQPWNPALRWREFNLNVSDPGAWLAELVRMIDAATTEREVQSDLFA